MIDIPTFRSSYTPEYYWFLLIFTDYKKTHAGLIKCFDELDLDAAFDNALDDEVREIRENGTLNFGVIWYYYYFLLTLI